MSRSMYLAAPYSARDRLRELSEELVARGHTVTSRWLMENHEIVPEAEGAGLVHTRQHVVNATRRDLDDVEAADLVILFTGAFVAQQWPELASTALHSGGRHVETGWALSRNKLVLVLGEPENVFQRAMCERLLSLHELYRFLDGDLICVGCGDDVASEDSVYCVDCLEQSATL